MAQYSTALELDSAGSVRRRARSPFFWFVVAVSLLVAAAYVFTFTAAARQNFEPAELGWSAVTGLPPAYIGLVAPDGPAAGSLRSGDRLVSINGDTRVADYGPRVVLAGIKPGATYAITVSRGRDLHSFTLPVSRYSRDDLLNYLPIALISLLQYIVAVCIGLLKPDGALTRLAFGAFMAGALVFLGTLIAPLEMGLSGGWLVAALAIRGFWKPFHLPLGYHFQSRFPQPVPEGRFARIFRVLLYVAAFVIWLPSQLLFVAFVTGRDSPAPLLPLNTLVQSSHEFLRSSLSVAASLGMYLVLVRNYRALRDDDSRRRIRWAGFGMACAILPYALFSIVEWALTVSGYRHVRLMEAMPALGWASMLMVSVAPIAVAYSVLRHRVLGIRVVIRRGVQYLLARNVLRVVILLPILAIVWQAVTNPGLSIAQILFGGSKTFYLFVVTSAAVSLRYRGQMTRWLDRRFFRTAYEQEQTLLDLIDRATRAESIDQLSRTVAEGIGSALHPSDLCIVCRRHRDDDLSAVYPPDSPLAHAMVSRLSAMKAPRWMSVAPACLEIGEFLFVPMSGTDRRIAGVLVLGPKKSEEPYTKRDRDLLLGIAGQMAIVLEIMWLKHRVREEESIRLGVLGRLDSMGVNLIRECPGCGAVYDNSASVCDRDGSPVRLTLPVERIVDGKYRLEQRIGTGGMGAVFRASDLRLDRTVAVKIMIDRLFGNQAALRRFEREARAVAQIEHRNIIAVYDCGQLPSDGAYLVMQLVRGASWRSELRLAGCITPRRLAAWLEQLCAAIARAHEKNVIHRDLKPENVIIATEDGTERIVVLDFGVAKMRCEESAADGQLTEPGVVLGTYAYMSPEQSAGREVDARTDIYSVGVMAVESLTGQQPPASGAAEAWMRSVLPEDIPAREPLLAAFTRCLAERPEDRFSCATEMQETLIPALVALAPIHCTAVDADAVTVALDTPISRSASTQS